MEGFLGLLPMWIIGSVLVLAVIDRMAIGSGKTSYKADREAFPNRAGGLSPA